MSLRHRFSLKRFFGGEGPESSSIFLTQRRVYILPSKMGVYFAVMMFVMLLGAVNYNNSLAYTLVFLLASIFFITILHTYRNLLHLRIDIGATPAVFCRDVADVSILIDNRRNKTRYAIRFLLGKRTEGQYHITRDVAGDQYQQVTVPLQTTKRGMHDMPRLTLETVYPLGLFRAWSYAQRDVQYLVYPEVEKQESLPSEQSDQRDTEGDQGQGVDDFAGLRNFQTGDSLRHVHWKTFAREQGMHTKQFGGDRASELWLDWNSLPKMEIESRLSRLARWVLEANAAHMSYGLRLPDKEILPNSGLKHKHECLKALALFAVD